MPLIGSDIKKFLDHLKQRSMAFFISNVDVKIQALLIELGLTNTKKIRQLAGSVNKELSNQLAKKLTPHFLHPEKNETELHDLVEWYLDSLRTHINEHTKVMDSRQHVEEDVIVRRMDALARLLKLKDSISVCIAVTLVNNTLYIALNNSGKNFKSTEVVATINARLNALIDAPFLKNLDQNITYDCFYNDHADAILKTYFHEELPKTRLKQDITKLFYSLHINSHQFKELNPLLSHQLERVFIYPQKNEGVLHYEVYHDTQKQAYSIPILNVPEHMTPNHIHAEQILVDYLMQYKKIESDYILKLGLSKLCCGTCYDCLSHYAQVKVRGTHGITYANTYNLKTCEVAKSDGITNRRHVHPQQSPTASPMKESAPNKITDKENVPFPINLKLKEPLFSESKQVFFKEAESKEEPEKTSKRRLFL